MPRLVPRTKENKTLADFGYKSAALPKYGGSGNQRLRGIPSYGYASPNVSYKVGQPGQKGVATSTQKNAPGVYFGGKPGDGSGYAINQQSYDVNNAVKPPSTSDIIENVVKYGVGSAALGSGLTALGAPTFGLPTLSSLVPEGSKFANLFGSGSSGIGSLGQALGKSPIVSGGGEFSALLNADGSPAMMKPGAEIGDFINYIRGKPSAFGGDLAPTADKFIAGKTPNLENPGFFDKVGNFFGADRAFLTGKDGVGLFGKAGQAGTGITSVGNVLGTVGGILSLADFIDDPSLASGLGTLAGAGASGISAFSGLATAAPWLAGAALVASLLMTKKPSNKTGYTSIDLDEFKPVSFGMEGGKYSKENVDQTMQIMEPIIPLIQEIEKQYGVDLQGDLQVNYGGRDGLAYNIGNRDVTGFRNRLDYFDGKDQSTRDGGSIYRRTFKGENAGKDFYKSLLGDLETLARQKQADGGGKIDLANFRGIQRQAPNYGNIQPTGMAGLPGLANMAASPQQSNALNADNFKTYA